MTNIKISELNELETRNSEDLLAIVDTNSNETKKIKVENLINENVELIAVSPTAPSECSLGDKYFNTTSNKLYTAIATDTWSNTGENAVEGILYIVFNEQSTYAYNGTTLVSVGGGSGSSDIVIIGDESETTEDTKLLVDTSGTTDTLKYKNNNTFTELQIKALDSMPVGTVVEFNGQASDIPSGWEEVSGENKIRKVSLKTPTGAHIVDGYSTSTTDGYSCNEVNNLVQDVYSTNEIKTNKVWIDGKTIYRKTFSISTSGANATWSTNLSSVNCDNVIKVFGIAGTSNLKTAILSDTQAVVFRPSSKAVEIYFNNPGTDAMTGYITIEYTKTTDV